MEEKEIEKIIHPEKKLWIFLISFVSIATLCIAFPFFIKFRNAEQNNEYININELVEKEKEQFVKIEIEKLPVMLSSTKKEKQLYFVTDTNNNIYVVEMFDETFKKIVETLEKETGKLKSPYEIKGTTKNWEQQIKNTTIVNSYRIYPNKKIQEENFTEYFEEFYISETKRNDRMISLSISIVFFGVFFLILVLGYLIPSLLKTKKTRKNKVLMDELRKELNNLTSTPYKKQRIYLTKNYIVAGLEVIEYKNIKEIFIEEVKKYGATIGKNLVIFNQEDKKIMIGSIAGTSNILEDILKDIEQKQNALIE